jgi:hypothetical protein
MKKILILGGYGNFGWRISRALAKANIPIVICGRSEKKATELTNKLQNEFPNSNIETSFFDVNKELKKQLELQQPLAVINTCGPFQNTNYQVAQNCIDAKVHYIDLSDGRDFVNNITSLDQSAKNTDILVVSGASTVPGLSSAVLEEYKNDFSIIESLKFGIAPGQKAPRGLATTKAILSYVGKKIKPFPGTKKDVYGWQDLYRQDYPEIGKRWMANCEIPDLDLLPKHYDIKSIQFSAGMESGALHLSIWLVSWIARIFPFINLQKYSSFFLELSNLFNFLGTDDGGMHIIIKGKDKNNKPLTKKWFIIAKSSDGPNIPTIPAIIIAKKLYENQLKLRGAMPCLGMVSLEEYLKELEEFDIKTYVID